MIFSLVWWPICDIREWDFGELDIILKPISMHNFIINNQSEYFIPAATTAVPNIGESDFWRIGESDFQRIDLLENQTFGELDFQRNEHLEKRTLRVWEKLELTIRT